MFAQHATAILVEKLYDSPYVIVESLFHVARLAGATSEVRLLNRDSRDLISDSQ